MWRVGERERRGERRVWLGQHGSGGGARHSNHQVQLIRQQATKKAGKAATAQKAYEQVRKENKHLACSAACQEHKADHVRRHAHKKCPARGFHHLASCPVRIAAEAARRHGLN